MHQRKETEEGIFRRKIKKKSSGDELNKESFKRE